METASRATSAPATTAADTFAARRQSPVQRVQNLLHSHPAISPLLVLVASWLVFSQLNSRFASAGSLSLVLQQAAVIAALAVGQTLIILTAGIDLSCGAIAIRETNQVLSMIHRVRENGMPVILISHNMPNVFEVADRIHIQRLGRGAGVITPTSHTMNEAVAIMTGATTLEETPGQVTATA